MLRFSACSYNQTYPKYKMHILKILGACLGLQLRVASANIHYDWPLQDRDIEMGSLATSAANETVLEATENERALSSVHVVHREGRYSAEHAHTVFTLAKPTLMHLSHPRESFHRALRAAVARFRCAIGSFCRNDDKIVLNTPVPPSSNFRFAEFIRLFPEKNPAVHRNDDSA